MFLPFSSLPGRLALVAAVAVLGTCVAGCPDRTNAFDPPVPTKADPKPSPTLTTVPVGAVDPIGNLPVATIDKIAITRNDIDAVMYEAFGPRILFDLVELDVAKEMVEQQGMTLTTADIDAEREAILIKICGADTDRASWDNLFNQFLQQKTLTRTEFEIKIVQTRACLRKVIAPLIVGKLPEPMIHSAFDQMFGAQRRIQDITLPDLAAASLALQKLSTESFDQVAKEMSIDSRTKNDGGHWQPFAHNNDSIAPVIRTAAFGLKLDQVSEPLQVGVNVHLIKVIEMIPPKISKYEQERDFVRHAVEQQLIDEKVNQQQADLQRLAEAQVKINDPIIRHQWEALLAGQKGSTRDRSQVLDAIAKQRPTTVPTTGPTTEPTFGPMMPTDPTTRPTPSLIIGK